MVLLGMWWDARKIDKKMAFWLFFFLGKSVYNIMLL